jgi:hypothetical protein
VANGAGDRDRAAGPSGIALAEDAAGRVEMIFIADYYNALVRVVESDGIIRNLSDEGRLVLGAPSRVAFDAPTNRLYIADSSNNQIVAVDIPQNTARVQLVPRRFVRSPAKKGT